jgi:hypothetical protein
MLATVIASLVLVAAFSLLAALERSEQSVRGRAHQLEQLQRTRLVMERAFSGILVSQPAPARRPATAVATPEGGDPDAPGADARASEAASRRRFAQNGGDKAGGSGGDGSARDSSIRDGATGSGRNAGATGASPSGVQAPDDAAPRIILHTDDVLASRPMTVRDKSGLDAVVTPQRLEIVLIEPPVPMQQPDPFVLAKAVKLETKRRGLSRERADEEQPPTPSEALPTQSEAPESDADWGIRAVRGAFELVPKPGRDGREALDEYGHPKAWELWWVPQAPRRSLREVREMGRARAVLEAASFGEPYLIATDLASMQWRMYDDRQHKSEFEATIQNQLPAYVEVDVTTTGGMSASWLFEVSWATGVETRPQESASTELFGVRRETDESQGADAGPGPRDSAAAALKGGAK